MKIQEEQKVTISPEVLFQEVSGEMVLLDLASRTRTPTVLHGPL
jgi:hypothetical protein